MPELRFYQRLKRLITRIVNPLEAEAANDWYEQKCYEMLEDMGRQAKLYSVSMTAIDSQGNRIIELEEQAREYRAQIRNLHKALDEACNEVCEDTQEKTQDLAMP